ncbi:MAG: maleylpyruvate isomerase N-terminal domain-containing protein [Chitinophagaceae bacterium]|nr:maleylpyruvate isomerase N-terminal domain-containing protein [Chitinophagaceae bacterium]
MIKTTHLFPILDAKLIGLLKSLSADEWNKKTIAKRWTVKDIAAHLLDGNLRTLSLLRDKHILTPEKQINSYQHLVEYLNRLNAEWVDTFKRVSPAVITELLEMTGIKYSEYLAELDPYADAIFSVAWAGEQVSKNWFHIAREYTEKWHHQQQIRDATGKQELMTKELFYPAMETFIRGLPHTYRDTIAEKGTIVQFTISTDIGGTWFLVRGDNDWKLSDELHGEISASLILQPDTAWKLFTRGMTPEAALVNTVINGDEKIAMAGLHLVAVMA